MSLYRKICPSCKRPAEKFSKSRTGDLICRSCKWHEDKTVGVDEESTPPESCPFCGSVPKRRRQWVLSSKGWHCRRCAGQVREGEVRVDKRGRFFEVKSGKAAYCFGDRKLPKWSEIALRSQLVAQTQLMWSRVEEHLGVGRRTARRAAVTGLIAQSDVEDAFHDACMPALMASAVMWSSDGEAAFPTYARSACYRALIRWSRRRKRRKEVKLADDLVDTRDEERLQSANEQIQAIKETMREKDLYLFEQHYIEGRTLHDIGVEMGVLPQAIFLRMKRARNRL